MSTGGQKTGAYLFWPVLRSKYGTRCWQGQCEAQAGRRRLRHTLLDTGTSRDTFCSPASFLPTPSGASASPRAAPNAEHPWGAAGGVTEKRGLGDREAAGTGAAGHELWIF